MSVQLIDDAAAFQTATAQLLTARVENNLLATVLQAVLDGRYDQSAPRFAVVRDDDGGEIVAAALRTPPYPITCTELSASDADQLVDAWLAVDPELPGVNGTPAVAQLIGDAWARRSGGTHHRSEAMALHALEVVADPPRPTTGALRPAQPADQGTVLEWCRAFDREAHGHEDTWRGEDAGRALLAADRAYLWDDAGQPVSLVGHAPPIAGVPRIGPVYTPPQRRGRGYAGHAVAQLSRRLLADGAHRCVLFTDLTNPTSNKIYAEVGYVRVSDWEQRVFHAPGQAAAESATG